MNMKTLRDLRDDRGMTLIELLISIAIFSVITGAIGMSMMVVVKNDSAAAGRLSNTKAAQSLNTWLTADVQSATGPGFNTDAGNTDGCPGGPVFPGVNRLRMELFNSGVSTSPIVVSYRVLNNQLVRVTCSTADPTPVVQVLIDGIVDPNDVTVTVVQTPSGAVDRVTISVTATVSGQTSTFTLSATPRGTVPATTVPSNPGGGGNGPCTYVSATTSNPVGLDYASDDRTRSVVVPGVVDISTSGTCAELRVSFETRPAVCVLIFFCTPANVETVYPGGGPTSWPLTIGASVAPNLWQLGSGTKTATLEGRTGSSWSALGTFTFTVEQAPCTFSSGSVSPDPVNLSGTGTSMTITTSATLTVNLGGVCDGVGVRAQIETRTGNTVTVPLAGSGLTRTATLSSTTAAGLWSVGAKTAVLQRDPGTGYAAFNPAATIGFNTQADTCAFVSGSLVNGAATINASGSLTAAVPIQVTTTNGCGTDLQLVVRTSSGNTQTIALTPATLPNPTAWNVTLPTSFEPNQWSAGDWTVLVRRPSGATYIDFIPVASFTMHVDALVCTVLAHSTTPDPVALTGASGSNRSLAAPFTLSVTTNAYCGTRLQVQIDTRDAGQNRTITQELTNGGNNTSWSYTFPASTNQTRWQGGNRDVTVQWRNGNQWTTVNPDPNFQITAAGLPCSYTSGSASTVNLLGTGASNRTVSGSSSITVVTSGDCSAGITVQFTPGTGAAQSITLNSGDGINWSGTIANNQFGAVWSTGTKTASVLLGGQPFTPPASFTFTAQQMPCTVTSGNVNPTVNLLGSGSTRTVTGSSTMTVNTSGECSAGVRAVFDNGSGLQVLSLSPNGANTVWTATVDATTFPATWSASTKTVTAQYLNGATWTNIAATFTFVAQQAPCVYSNGSVTGTVQLLGTSGAQTVSGSNAVSVSTTASGECSGGVRLSFNAGSGTVTVPLTPNPGFTTWTGAINNTVGSGLWSAGSKSATVQYFNGSSWVSFTPNATVSFTASGVACTYSAGSGSVTPSPLRLTRSGTFFFTYRVNGTYTLSITTTAACGDQLRALITVGGTNTDDVVLTANAANTTWSGTIDNNVGSNNWQPGTRNVRIQRFNGSTWVDIAGNPTFTFTAVYP